MLERMAIILDLISKKQVFKNVELCLDWVKKNLTKLQKKRFLSSDKNLFYLGKVLFIKTELPHCLHRKMLQQFQSLHSFPSRQELGFQREFFQ